MYDDRKYKSTADKIARDLRKKGIKARVVPEGGYMGGKKLYSIYMRETNHYYYKDSKRVYS